MTLTAAEFLTLGAARRVTVQLDGGEILVRELSVADRSLVLALSQTDKARVPALVVRLCAINSDGTPLFDAGQDEAIAALRLDVVDVVAHAVMLLGGMMMEEGGEKKD